MRFNDFNRIRAYAESIHLFQQERVGICGRLSKELHAGRTLDLHNAARCVGCEIRAAEGRQMEGFSGTNDWGILPAREASGSRSGD